MAVLQVIDQDSDSAAQSSAERVEADQEILENEETIRTRSNVQQS